MASPQTINGSTGPYTGQKGGYGKNAAANVKTYLTQPPSQPGNPSSPVGGSPFDGFGDIVDIFNGQGGFPSPEKLLEKAKSKMSKGPELPTVQYTEASRLNQASMYDDLLGYSAGILNLGSVETKVVDQNSSDDEKKAAKDQVGPFGPLGGDPMMKMLLKLLGGLFPGMGGLDDPSKMFDQMFGGNNPFKMILQSKTPDIGLSKEVLDRNKDGNVDVAEKSAETLFFDNSVAMLREAIADKIADPTALQDNFDQAMAYTNLDETLKQESSVFDGQVTAAERKSAISAAGNAQTSSLVGQILDRLIVKHDLRAKAEGFQA